MFNQRCPEYTVTNNKDRANYAVILDHEGGKGVLAHRNKIAVFNRDGDAVFSDSTRSLGMPVSQSLKTENRCKQRGFLIQNCPSSSPGGANGRPDFTAML